MRSGCCCCFVQAVEGAPLPPLAEGEVSRFANWMKLLHQEVPEPWLLPQVFSYLMLLGHVSLCSH